MKLYLRSLSAVEARRIMKNRKAFLAAMTFLIFTAASAFGEPQKGKPQTLQERVQGAWSRPNYGQVYVIKGNDFTQYSKNRPLHVAARGKLIFLKNKDYAEVKADNGYTLWLFAAGEDKIVSEDFKPDGALSGNGTLLYRQSE